MQSGGPELVPVLQGFQKSLNDTFTDRDFDLVQIAIVNDIYQSKLQPQPVKSFHVIAFLSANNDAALIEWDNHLRNSTAIVMDPHK
jgi:hypothetical protein